MSTSATLPAGFSITTINGVRCTAVPRSLTTVQGSVATAASAAVTSTTSTEDPDPGTNSSSDQTQNPPDAGGATSISPTTSLAVTSVTSTPTTSTSIASSTSAELISISTTPESISSTSISSARPASKGTTPTISSSTAIPLAQSDARPSPTASGLGNDGGFQTIAASKVSTSVTSANTAKPEESSATAGISSNPRLTPAPVVGGVLGSMGLIAIAALIFWLLRKRRRVKRDSLLTPLGTGTRSQFYEIDNGSVGPTKRSKKWKAEVGYQTARVKVLAAGIKSGVVDLGSSLKSKVVGERSDTPSVNLNRGNSQFLDGPIPQHSRNNSILSQNPGNLTVKDRLADLWERFTESVSFNWRMRRKERESFDPYAAARGMKEKEANMGGPPDFSQLLGMEDRELHLHAERRRASLTGPTSSLPQLGSLGLDFGSDDPFADPIVAATSKDKSRPWQPPNPSAGNAKSKENPFADPMKHPEPSIPKASTYISDIRRSRGQSMDTTNNPTNSTYGPASRYPSTIATSRDSYRDTVFTSFSANGRKGKGRSDPFDLERPELWRPKQVPPQPDNSRTSLGRPRGASTSARDSSHLYPSPLRMSSLRGQPAGPTDSHGAQPRVVSVQTPRIVSGGTYASKYSSGVTSLSEWGDPGPDLGPGSGSSSLRGNASSNGSEDYGANDGRGVYSGAQGIIKGNLAEIPSAQDWDSRRQQDNVSPVSVESKASSKGGVGKAL